MKQRISMSVRYGAQTKNESSYSYTMNNRIVDGSKNGKYHTFSEGNVYITGEHWIESTEVGASPEVVNEISYCLIRKRTGPDVSCGVYSCEINERVSGVLGTADKQSDEYYLQIYRAGDDGNNIGGYGKIYQ